MNVHEMTWKYMKHLSDLASLGIGHICIVRQSGMIRLIRLHLASCILWRAKSRLLPNHVQRKPNSQTNQSGPKKIILLHLPDLKDIKSRALNTSCLRRACNFWDWAWGQPGLQKVAFSKENVNRYNNQYN